ncbi:MAG: isocitrate/isopropylmalate family dehydrogenase, partial [Alcaligenaceae bacterium]
HGSAPDIAGKGIANPISLLLASGLMLDHVGHSDLANRLRNAIDLTLNQDNIKTTDLGGKATTIAFTEALVKRIKG